MNYFTFLLLIVVNLLSAQSLTPNGMEPIITSTDLSQKENYEKIHAYASDYLVDDDTKITKAKQNESITIQGKRNHVACYINTTMGSKTCFELQYVMEVKTLDKSFEIHVKELNAVNEERHPGKNYDSWFDETGKAYPALQSCVDGTTDFFYAFQHDFVDYIENGDYW